MKDRLAEKDIHIFNEVYQVRNETGIVLDFKEHGFLWDIYSDLSPHQAIRKCAQVGFSTTAIIKSIWLARNRKMDMIYTLPTFGDVHDFVTNKVNRIIDINPVIKGWTGDKDRIEQKKFGDSIINYRGTWSERSALMISSDLNIHDEADRSNLKVIEQYASRLQHSKYGWQWIFSNPSAPDQGVDKRWNRSDQKHWFIKCSACNHYQFLTMANLIKVDGKHDFVCTKCHRPIDRTKGQWVARWRDKEEISGYWISLLMAPWVSADHIKLLEETKPADYFANFVLGEPYVGAGNTTSRDMIVKNLTSLTNSQDGDIVIGVDTGVDIRYVIGNAEGIFYYGQCVGYEEIEHLLRRYPKATAIIDQGGDIVAPRKLRDKYGRRVYLAHYQGNSSGDDLFTWDDDEKIVHIQRNRGIQLLVDEFNEKRIPIYGNETDWEAYIRHWLNIYRVGEENSLGVMVYKWLRSDRDDWVHATLYWRAGIDRFMNAKGAIISATPVIGTPGYTDNRFTPTRNY